MSLKVALVLSEAQIEIKSLDIKNKSISSKLVDSHLIQDENINLLMLDNTEDMPGLAPIFEKEAKFYPIVPINGIGMTKEQFADLDFSELKQLYTKVAPRWILNNNITSIEQLYPMIVHLKDLWVRDRNSFFEELWFLLKTNMATTELTIIFNDLKEPTDKQKEKGEKPSLCRSYVQGQKLPNLFEAKEKENILMKEYEKEFSGAFNITEFSAEKGELVACAKINLSPVLILAKLPDLNQLQQSLLVAIFNGLQE